MIAKVVLGTMQNARKLVSIVEAIPYDAELCAGRYVVNAKSMLGVLSMPDFETGELHVHTDNAKECEKILFKLLEAGLLMDTNDAVCRSIYDITTFGEILIDFTSQGKNEDGQMLYARNPGGAPANVAVAAGRLGAHTAFIGKAGNDMQGKFLRSVLEKENVDVKGMLMDDKYFTTLAFVEVSESGERTFAFARKPGADTKIQKEELDIDILDQTYIFHVGSLSLTEQPARDTTFYAVKRAKNKGSIISYDPNYRASLWENEETAIENMRSLIPYVDIMKISDEEIELLTEYKNMMEAVEELYTLVIETYENKAAKMEAGAIDHIAIDVKDIEKVYEMISEAGLNTTKDTVHFLPFWENGVKFFTIEGPNKEKVEFSQYL